MSVVCVLRVVLFACCVVAVCCLLLRIRYDKLRESFVLFAVSVILAACCCWRVAVCVVSVALLRVACCC